MGMMTLQQALGFVRQRIPSAHLVGDGATPLARVHTDTRTLQAGDLFVALKGERFDANAFLPQAQASGAAAALAHGGVAAAGLSGIEVPDTLAAFGALAAGWRAQFTLPLIGVTGSNGKTTVTQMIASILRAWKGEAAFATQGNFNNDIGVPLMLLRLTAAHEAAVIELGMNHPVGRQRGQHRAVFFRHRLYGVHELQVLALGVVDQGHRGAGHGCQRGNFAGVVHAQFHHRQSVV